MSVSTPYAGNPANSPATIPVPDDGDFPTGALFSVPLEGLKDLCAHIIAGGTTFTGSKAFMGQVNFADDVSIDGSKSWLFSAPVPTFARGLSGISFEMTTGVIRWPAVDLVGVDERVRYELAGIPNGATLISIGARINPVDDALPTTKFRSRLVRIALDGSGSSTVATIEDPAAGAGYQAAHLFTATFNHVINLNAYTYALEFLGESGGDADAVQLLCAPILTYSVAEIDWGG